jgi:hypothetical protein
MASPISVAIAFAEGQQWVRKEGLRPPSCCAPHNSLSKNLNLLISNLSRILAAAK